MVEVLEEAIKLAQVGIDAVATTAVYFGKPLDMTAKIEKMSYKLSIIKQYV